MRARSSAFSARTAPARAPRSASSSASSTRRRAGRTSSVLTEDVRPARRRVDEAEEEADRGALAGAVRAEKAEDLARMDGDRQVVERPDRRESGGPAAPAAR